MQVLFLVYTLQRAQTRCGEFRATRPVTHATASQKLAWRVILVLQHNHSLRRVSIRYSVFSRTDPCFVQNIVFKDFHLQSLCNLLQTCFTVLN
ncbi:hypothetical protein QL285_069962 [Trifolium repens]|nr:hypothetical protein QL285_069962 [Trifolium repens]